MDARFQTVSTTAAPTPIGPYSQGVIVGDRLYVAGQIGQDPATKALVEGDIREQTERVIDNIVAVLEAADTNLGRVCDVDVSLVDLDRDLETFNEVYARRFSGGDLPARKTRQAAKLAMGALVEVACVAYVPPKREMSLG